MDEDRIKGTVNDLTGRAKDALGGLTGDTRTQAEGKFDQVRGRAQGAYGSARDSLGNSDVVRSFGADLQRFTQERPLLALLLAAGVGYGLRSFTRRR